VICETKCIWSHYLLLDREKSLPDLALSLRTRAGPLQPIDATTQLCRTDYPAPWDWLAALTIAHASLQGFSTPATLAGNGARGSIEVRTKFTKPRFWISTTDN
jgi:hypothetical protein